MKAYRQALSIICFTASVGGVDGVDTRRKLLQKKPKQSLSVAGGGLSLKGVESLELLWQQAIDDAEYERALQTMSMPTLSPKSPPTAAPVPSPPVPNPPTDMPTAGSTASPSDTPTVPAVPTASPKPTSTPQPTRTPTATTDSPTAEPTRTPTRRPTLPPITPTVPPTRAPVPCVGSREDYILNVLTPITDEDILLDLNTPQGQAYRFLIEDTDFLVNPCDQTVEQRYGLATMYFSTGGDNWTNNQRWLAPVHECTWTGVTCNNDLLVTELQLGKQQSMLAGYTEILPVSRYLTASPSALSSSNEWIGWRVTG